MVRSVTLLTINVTLSLERPHISCKDARPEALAGTKSPPSPGTTHADRFTTLERGGRGKEKRKKRRKKREQVDQTASRDEKEVIQKKYGIGKLDIGFAFLLEGLELVKLQLILVNDVNCSRGQLDELNFPV